MGIDVVRRGIESVESLRQVDGAADAVQETLRRAVPQRPATDAIAGSWLGHPTHPLLVQVPIGAWLSASVLDLVPGQEVAARRLVLTGLLAVAPAAFAGLLDFRDLDRRQRRVAVVHAMTNTIAGASFAVSYGCRLRGRTGAGRVWSAVGLAAVMVGGTLGGHLSYAQGAGVRRWYR